ncbi:hypothetical protein [Dietzia sp. NCCP-2495]|uniref:hypothetical protein n=1 Tax=Dietzia sp. NCCP-2495 TaxID=2934675 RepID=UPI002231A5B8|nr:hypothetical protein [Dietzia sp. NCCP-2495]
MPKKIDPAVKERALRMVAEHRGEYASLTACCDQIGRRLELGKENGPEVGRAGRHRRRSTSRRQH